MKFTKLSLVAALAMNVAFAGGDIAPVEPVVEAAPVVSESTITGNVKLWYGTDDRGVANSLFSKNGAFGDAYADIKYSRNVMENVTLNLGMAYLTTLGLENDLVNGTWADHGAARYRANNPLPVAPTAAQIAAQNTGAAAAAVGDAAWINEANVVIGGLPGSSFLKIGRQELDTPFFYSEKWSIATNTFDAAVAGTNVLPDTTLIAAWVGRGNGVSGGSVVALNNTNFGGGHVGFTAAVKPAYAFAAINKSISDTTLQAWYYEIPSVATAYWLQADVAFGEFSVGGQYAGTELTATNAKTSAYAVKLAYASGALKAHVAYSDRDNKAGIDISNIATGHSTGSESSLYTEAYWNYGHVGSTNAKTVAVGASYDLGMAQLGAQYTNVNAGLANTNFTSGDMTEFALTASTKVGPVNADLAYVYDETGVAQNGASTVLIMLSMPFSL